MPVVNTTSPSAGPSAPQSSPSKRVPSSSSTYPSRRWLTRSPAPCARSQNQLLDGLELGCAGALQELEQRALDGADDGSGALQALQAAVVVDSVARADGVGGHVDFDAAVEQVVHGL